jgi:hypothetical protein
MMMATAKINEGADDIDINDDDDGKAEDDTGR